MCCDPFASSLWAHQAEMNDSEGSNSNDKESYELLFIMSGTGQGKCYLQGPADISLLIKRFRTAVTTGALRNERQ